MDLTNPKLNYFINARHRFIERRFVIRLFAVVSGMKQFIVSGKDVHNNSQIYVYDDEKHVQYDLVKVEIDKQVFYGYVHTVIPEEEGSPATVNRIITLLEKDTGKPLFSFPEPIQIQMGDIENYSGTTPIKTCWGRYFLNYVLFVYSSGSKIEYWNNDFDIGKIQTMVIKLMLDGTITIPEFKKYSRAVFENGHFPEICVPTVTKKSLSISPRVKKLRAELLEQHKDQLTDPIIAKLIQDTLIAADREDLKGDESEKFYNSRGSSAWNIQRAKMVINIGGIPSFSDEVGKLSYIPNALMDGWDKNHLATIANETYKSSYSRGTETQLGGNQTNIVIRIFQASKIDGEDCGSTQGIGFDVTSKNIESFDGMYEAGTNIIISKENYSSFIGKRVYIRSPETCKLSPGARYCMQCHGELYRKRGVRSLELGAIYCTSTMMQLSMKNMHGTEIKTFNVNFRNYLVSTF